MNKFISIGLGILCGAVVCTVVFLSCVSVPAEQLVVVPIQGLKLGTVTAPGEDNQAAVVALDTLPEAIREAILKLYPGIDIVAITTKQHVIEAVPPVQDNPLTIDINEASPGITAPSVIGLTPIFNEDGTVDWAGYAAGFVSTAAGLIPQAAPFLPLAQLVFMLFKKRSKKHLATVASSLNPLNGKAIDFVQAWSSLKKAYGLEHSTNDPEQLRRVADKIEANTI